MYVSQSLKHRYYEAEHDVSIQEQNIKTYLIIL